MEGVVVSVGIATAMENMRIVQRTSQGELPDVAVLL